MVFKMSKEFESIADRLPPQNIEAEEAVLGGILIDPEAVSRVLDTLRPEMFYVSAHQEIFRACLMLHNQSNPTDMMSLTTWLSDRDMLEKIGGQTKIAQLCDRTVSAVNIDFYAQLVSDKYARRKLAEAARTVVEISYDNELELTQLLDQSEQKIFAVTQSRSQQGLVPASDILTRTFSELENRFNSLGTGNNTATGLITGFYDFDAMTNGLQRSDLIIIAGRPSMGKTAFGLELARKMAEIHRLPVAIFSLEMSKEQLVYRLLASQSKVRSSDMGIDSNRLRSGQISENEWGTVAMAISGLSDLPLFIDDTPNPPITELRSKSRRLQSEKGGSLGLILIDYLQLMEGSGSDNRVQEISRITRSLKALARELNVPVIALSQLSRGVEARTNKRPMLSDLRESGCLSGDSLITMADTGAEMPIRDLVGRSGFAIWAINPQTLRIERAIVSNAFCTGLKSVYKLETQLGRSIKATANHKFLTIHGWKRLDQLQIGDRLAMPRQIPSPELQTSGTSLHKTAISRDRAHKLAEILESTDILNLATSDIYWDKVVSIDSFQEEMVYDLTVPTLENFAANNFYVHNSIEQDADLVINLYRDEYYNPETPDRGVAEIIIAKHRNGPVGTIKLLFEPRLTKFENMASGRS